MIIRCVICSKGAATGNKISHSHKASKRRFHANLQKLQLKLNGQTQKSYVCTNCIRSGKVEKA